MKDLRSRQLRTVFGAVDVFCRRFVRCTCRGGKPRAAWPLRGNLRKCATYRALSLCPARLEPFPVTDRGICMGTHMDNCRRCLCHCP